MIDRLYPGGTETQLVALIRHLDRRRVQPFLCLLDGEDSVSRGMEPADCPVLRLGVRSLRRPQSVGKAWHFARFLRRERIDVLQIYFPDSTYFGVPVARLAGIPYVLRTRNNINHWMTPLHLRLGRLLNRAVTGTITNCEASRQAVLADEAPPPTSVIVLQNGVDLSPYRDFAPGRATSQPGGRRVGLVANLRRVKGVDLLVEAAARLRPEHPDVTFVVAGDGAERAALEKLIAELGLQECFCLLGNVKDIPEFLATLDVAVLCSRAEGMPNAVLEYMAAGRAIVTTAVGAAPHLIKDKAHGLLVPPEDPAALAQGIGRLLSDAPFAQRLAKAAQQRARQHYGRETMVRAFETFYERLVLGRSTNSKRTTHNPLPLATSHRSR
jgi:glycosyltransferase involved in cell wall biosynthesis